MLREQLRVVDGIQIAEELDEVRGQLRFAPFQLPQHRQQLGILNFAVLHVADEDETVEDQLGGFFVLLLGPVFVELAQIGEQRPPPAGQVFVELFVDRLTARDADGAFSDFVVADGVFAEQA